MTDDVANSLFTTGAAFILLLNVRQLYRDKRVSGCSPYATAYMTAWGVYQCLRYYPTLNQSWSCVASYGIVMANAAWLVMAWHYSRKGTVVA